MKLREVQDHFKDVILDPAILKDEKSALLFKQGGLSLESRMKVYRNNVIRTLSDAIIATFPMIEKLIGEECLQTTARAYVRDNLPEDGDLYAYGSTFAEFLDTYEPLKELAYLPDMARLEWAWETSGYAPDDETLDPAALQSIPEDTLPDIHLNLRQSIKLLSSPYPLDRIVDFCRTEPDEHDVLDVSPAQTWLMIFRPHLQCQMRKLEESEFALLAALQEGKTIGEACERCLPLYPRMDLTALMQKHFTLGSFRKNF